MYQNPELRRAVIMKSFIDHCIQAGDAFLSAEELYQVCLTNSPFLSIDNFHDDIQALIKSGFLIKEADRIYLVKNWLDENTAARCMAHILQLPPLHVIDVPDRVEVDGILLTHEQRNAVAMALRNRISLILGGAGTGKTTIIKAILQLSGFPEWYQTLSCAPTGKAVRNLAAHGILPARTIHSAMGIKTTDDDDVSLVSWRTIRLVNIDELSMVTTHHMAMILAAMDNCCRLVLIGDDQQLPPIGAGNVINDLRSLDVPCIVLHENHRLHSDAHCLTDNVLHFDEMVHRQDFKIGDSFDIIPTSDLETNDRIAQDAAERIKLKQNIQVICAYNSQVHDINKHIQSIVNPKALYKKEIRHRNMVLRDGDRVIITRNDRDRGCYNGDIGTLRIHHIDQLGLAYTIILPNGHTIMWRGQAAVEQLNNMILAYAITVHRAQGSEYDYVMMPVHLWMKSLLTRNMLYTAISRAKRQMLIYGDPNAIDMALAKELPARNSMLVSKTRVLMSTDELPVSI